MHKDGLRYMPAGGFQQVEGTDRVHVEVVERPGGSQIMAELGSRMDNKRRPKRFQEQVYATPVADIEFVVVEILVCGLEPALIPAGIAPGTEEIRAHVIINAMDFPVQFTKVINHFRTN